MKETASSEPIVLDSSQTDGDLFDADLLGEELVQDDIISPLDVVMALNNFSDVEVGTIIKNIRISKLRANIIKNLRAILRGVEAQ